MNYLIGIAILCILYIVFVIFSRRTENILLRGFWKADAEFCQSAELEFFILYIGEQKSSGSYAGYMLAKNAAGIIINSPVIFQISWNLSIINPFINGEKTTNLHIKWLDTANNKNDAFPSDLLLTHYPLYNKIVLHDKHILYGTFYKDAYMSALENDNLLPSLYKEGMGSEKRPNKQTDAENDDVTDAENDDGNYDIEEQNNDSEEIN